MTPEEVMKKCQIGTHSRNEGNSLHAECYGTIGRLLAENKRLKEYISGPMATNIRTLNAQYTVAEELLATFMMRYEGDRFKQRGNIMDAVKETIAARLG
jgi:hypothetical protein